MLQNHNVYELEIILTAQYSDRNSWLTTVYNMCPPSKSSETYFSSQLISVFFISTLRGMDTAPGRMQGYPL